MRCDAFMNDVMRVLTPGTSPDIQVAIGDQVVAVDRVENCEDDEGTIMVVGENPRDPLEHLKLIIVYWEGNVELWSLALRKVICVAAGGRGMRTSHPIPTLNIDAPVEAEIIRSMGARYDGSAPTHDEVFEYLTNHPELVTLPKEHK